MSGRSEQRLSKRQQRLAEKGTNKSVEKFPTIGQLHLELKPIVPMTDNQVTAFNAYDDGKNLCLLGCAGTGKSFLSVYNAMKDINDKTSPYRRLVIIRSAKSSRELGFLPGDEKRKVEVYEAPYKAIFAELYRRGDAYDILKQKGIVEFTSTSFLRGTTIDDAIILFDEVQNTNFVECRTVLTRVGENSRVIICGDARQDDLTSERYKEESGLTTLTRVLEKMGLDIIHFQVEDIVRSGFVRSFIEAEYELGLY